MKSVCVAMMDKNVGRILRGIKTTTLRTKKEYNSIGLAIGEIGLADFGGKEYVVECKGFMSVDEAGGKEAVWDSEGFGDDGPSFDHVKKWLNGFGKLYVYNIKSNS